MKTCSQCKETKPLAEFQKLARNKDGHTGICKPCKRAYDNSHYSTNRARRSPYIQANIKTRQEVLMEHVKQYLTAHPCVDCGETRFPVLDFDHRDGEVKIKTISKLIAQATAVSRLNAEIAKCDVRCANCHRMRTAKQFGWRKLEW